MAKKRDHLSIEWSRKVLGALGCPDVRRGEGTDEWRRTQGSYTLSPDLVAGPLVGAGDPSDFYIDVLEPSGDQYVKPLAGNPGAAVTLVRAVVEHGSFNLSDVRSHEHFYGPMNRKIEKYAGGRGNTPMFGLALFFKYTGNQYVGPIVAALDALVALDRGFGITHHLGRGAMDRVMRGVLSPGQQAFVLSLPIAQPLSMVLYVAEKVDGPRVVLLVNVGVKAPTHPYAGHPVIEWLRRMATPDASPTAS